MARDIVFSTSLSVNNAYVSSDQRFHDHCEPFFSSIGHHHVSVVIR